MDKAGNSTARPLFGVAAGLALSMVALGVLTASASGIGRVEGEGWIVVSSNRDGKERVYSVAEDGTRLSPLLPRKPRLQAVAVSPDGNTIAYSADFDALAPLYVARADGSGLRRLGRKGIDPAFSPTGKLLAFVSRDGIWVVRSDGGGLEARHVRRRRNL